MLFLTNLHVFPSQQPPPGFLNPCSCLTLSILLLQLLHRSVEPYLRHVLVFSHLAEPLCPFLILQLFSSTCEFKNKVLKFKRGSWQRTDVCSNYLEPCHLRDWRCVLSICCLSVGYLLIIKYNSAEI